ncbi:B12-binding domain-containing radical SAM protein, partial [bacterium]|nr:B12-binding domain-containing radical SAM protein [bacterium]
MNTIDALLVLPPMYQFGRISDHNPKEPMGLMYIDAMLKKEGYVTEILDADILALTLEQTVCEIVKRKAKIIGFSVMQRALPSVKLLVEKLRNSGVNSHICCGGFTATLSAKHILEKIPGIDSVVLGEGEVTFFHLTKSIKEYSDWKYLPGIAFRQNNLIKINPPAIKVDIDFLSWPSRDLLPICFEKTNYATILASRGCYGICTFCSNQAFEKASIGLNWRGRNPINVVDEIDEVKKIHGVNVFKFNDPNLFGPGYQGRQHVVDICDEIIRRKIDDLHFMGFCRSNDIDKDVAQLMKQAGFERILIGIESANPEVLRLFRKGESLQTICQSIYILRHVGIDIVPGFMIFNPYTTIKTLETDINFLETYGFMPTLSKSLRIFDGTPIQEIMA